MQFDMIAIVIGALLGISQGWTALARPLPRNLKRAAAMMAISGLGLLTAGAAHIAGAPATVRTVSVIASLVFFLIWLLMIVSLARHNTSM